MRPCRNCAVHHHEPPGRPVRIKESKRMLSGAERESKAEACSSRSAHLARGSGGGYILITCMTKTRTRQNSPPYLLLDVSIWPCNTSISLSSPLIHVSSLSYAVVQVLLILDRVCGNHTALVSRWAAIVTRLVPRFDKHAAASAPSLRSFRDCSLMPATSAPHFGTNVIPPLEGESFMSGASGRGIRCAVVAVVRARRVRRCGLYNERNEVPLHKASTMH